MSNWMGGPVLVRRAAQHSVSTDPAAIARDDAIDRAEQHAQREWLHAAEQALYRVACESWEFTSEAIWEKMLGWYSREPRALGAVMRTGMREQWITPTDHFVPSTSARNHKRPLRVWRSRIYTGAAR